MDPKIVGEAITFDDVLILPRRSEIVPTQVSTATRISRRVELQIPILSAAMDTVTEARLAIALAQEGGLGVIHKNLSKEDQSREVMKVKRSENGVINDPICLPPDETIGRAREIMHTHNISGIPIVDHQRLVGILTGRDLRFQNDDLRRISEVMTRDHLVTAPRSTTLEQARQILFREKVEKLLLVDDQGTLQGLITIKDIQKLAQFPHACKDSRGRLRVGAAIGVFDYERAEALVREEVDLLVVDTAHGHSKNVMETIAGLKQRFDVDVMAGNIATAEAAEDLIRAGVDGLKVGIGPGSICTTRIIAGIGVPQISAVMECARVAEKHQVPICADGGIRNSGDISKAIAAGAHAVMIGGLFAGLEESPGEVFLFKDGRYKVYRGMGSLGAMVAGSKARYGQDAVTEREKLVPEGVEGRVPYKGALSEFVYQMVGGLRAGMGYTGSNSIEELRKNARFIRMSAAGLRESHPHDIMITREAPNYRFD